MNYLEEYRYWLTKADANTISEIKSITSENEIKERFYKNLEFGTGGLRGIMGAGTNRMNNYVIGKATRGLAEYIINQGTHACSRGVVIAYDSRNNSKEFAMHTAKVLCACNVKAYLFESLRPTPMLSFAVRYLKAFAGIVVTASHNPKEYNGYKVYFEDGGQLPPRVADKVLSYIDQIDVFDVVSESNNEPIMIGATVDEEYYKCVMEQSINDKLDKSKFKLVYTPLHGSGNVHVREVLKRQGYKNVFLVDEQVEPDGNFPTVKSPNPENKECFTRAIEIAKENNCDLIIGTDPDCDRVGIVVRSNKDEYVALTGNQVGALLTDYILSQKALPEKPAIVSTIVSSRIIEKICSKYNVKYFDVLTGFKFIGEKIHEFEVENTYQFILGLEESYGYLAGTYARDKDAVVASMLICEMAVYYNKIGMTLFEKLSDIYKEYGYYLNDLLSIELKGIDGIEKMNAIMSTLRSVTNLKKYGITKFIDYKNDETGLPKSDVLCAKFGDGQNFIVRPSGTEPKIKLYFSALGKNKEEAESRLLDIKAIAQKLSGLKIVK